MFNLNYVMRNETMAISVQVCYPSSHLEQFIYFIFTADVFLFFVFFINVLIAKKKKSMTKILSVDVYSSEALYLHYC